MPQQLLSPEAKKALYQKTIKQEFIRELNFLIDVLANRAAAKSDLTDKLLSGISQVSSVVTGGVIPNQFVSGTVSIFINTALDAINDKRKQPKMNVVADIRNEMVQDQLEILLEQTAHVVYQRYQFAIDTKLADSANGIFSFAQIGVERMLEFIFRTNKELTIDNLLQGLIEGRSGAYVTGFSNARLPAKDAQESLTAEGIYGRSGFRTPDGQYWILTRNKTKHKQTTGTIDRLKKAWQGEYLYEYGYSHLIEDDYPKYGYAFVLPEIKDFYGYETHMPQNPEFLSLLDQHPLQTRIISRQDIENYIANKNISLIDYIAQQHPGTKMVICKDDLSGLDLSGGNFSNCDFSYANLTNANLANCNFQDALLYYTKLNQVKAVDIHLRGAHLEYAQLDEGDFSGGDFTQACLNYAKLAGTNLSSIKQYGTSWLGTNISEIKQDKLDNSELINSLVAEQQQQHQALQEKLQQQQIDLNNQLQKQQEDISKISDNNNAQQMTIVELLEKIDNLIEENKSDRNISMQLVSMQQAVEELTQAKKVYETFEHYCQGEIAELHRQADKVNSNSFNEQLTKFYAQLEELKQSQVTFAEFQAAAEGIIIDLRQTKFNDLKRDIDLFKSDIEQLAINYDSTITTFTLKVNGLHAELQAELNKLQQKVGEHGTRLDQVEGRLDKIENAGIQINTPESITSYSEIIKQLPKDGPVALDNDIAEGIFMLKQATSNISGSAYAIRNKAKSLTVITTDTPLDSNTLQQLGLANILGSSYSKVIAPRPSSSGLAKPQQPTPQNQNQSIKTTTPPLNKPQSSVHKPLTKRPN